jgi:hypothetical protein
LQAASLDARPSTTPSPSSSSSPHTSFRIFTNFLPTFFFFGAVTWMVALGIGGIVNVAAGNSNKHFFCVPGLFCENVWGRFIKERINLLLQYKTLKTQTLEHEELAIST